MSVALEWKRLRLKVYICLLRWRGNVGHSVCTFVRCVREEKFDIQFMHVSVTLERKRLRFSVHMCPLLWRGNVCNLCTFVRCFREKSFQIQCTHVSVAIAVVCCVCTRGCMLLSSSVHLERQQISVAVCVYPSFFLSCSVCVCTRACVLPFGLCHLCIQNDPDTGRYLLLCPSLLLSLPERPLDESQYW